MPRESCIQHPAKQHIAIVRQDYFELTGDCVSAAILNEFEHRANAALMATKSDVSRVNVGKVSISDLQSCLLGLATDKQIRTRLRFLRSEGHISFSSARGKTPEFWFNIDAIQAAVRSNNPGQITEEERSNNRGNFGQITEQLRSNNRYSLYKKDLDLSLEPREPEGKGKSEEGKPSNPNPEPEPTESTAFLSSQGNESRPQAKDRVGDNFSGPPRDRFAELFHRQLPTWRTGWGPNDWHEPTIEAIREWLDSFGDGGKTRADAISYVVKREKDDRPEHPALLARVEGLRGRIAELESQPANCEPERLSIVDRIYSQENRPKYTALPWGA